MARRFILLLMGAIALVPLGNEARLSANGIVSNAYAYVAGDAAPRPLERPPVPVRAGLDDCLRGTGHVNGTDIYAAFCADLASFMSNNSGIVAQGDAMPVEPPEHEMAEMQEAARPFCATDISPDVGRNEGKKSEVILVPHGCSVPSPANGKILYAGFFQGYLGVIILELENEARLTVAGLGNVSVRRGDEVLAGNEIGVSSETVAPALADAAEGGDAALLVVADATAVTPAS